MAADAKAYSEVNQPQFKIGAEFIRKVGLSLGNKVLDMGCGTGELTKFIAKIVGPDGHVVGIDPDAARIKIAEQKFSEIRNLQFHVGSSATGFPHDNEPYYDVHVSNFAFHWVSDEEKKIYIQKAYQCLKPGGRLAISCIEKLLETKLKVVGLHGLYQDGYQKLFQDIGLFSNVVVNKLFDTMSFKSFEHYKKWFKASNYNDLDKVDPEYVNKFATIAEDGSVRLMVPCIEITADKM